MKLKEAAKKIEAKNKSITSFKNDAQSKKPPKLPPAKAVKDEWNPFSLEFLSRPEEGASAVWANRGYGLFRDKVGEELCDELKEKQFKVGEGSGMLGELAEQLGGRLKLLRSRVRLETEPPSPPPRVSGAAGFAKIIENPKFPEHSFFNAGRMFKVRMRHNNLILGDDAGLDVRVTCIKLCDDDIGGPLDLILYTGRFSPYYNLQSFDAFTEAFKKDKGVEKWVYRFPINYHGRVEGLRRAPASYYSLRYHSHVTYRFNSLDGVANLARLRLLPADGTDETGLLDGEDQEQCWRSKRRHEEDREDDYLHAEFRKQLGGTAPQYRLQIQTRPVPTASDLIQKPPTPPKAATPDKIQTPSEPSSYVPIQNAQTPAVPTTAEQSTTPPSNGKQDSPEDPSSSTTSAPSSGDSNISNKTPTDPSISDSETIPIANSISSDDEESSDTVLSPDGDTVDGSMSNISQTQNKDPTSNGEHKISSDNDLESYDDITSPESNTNGVTNDSIPQYSDYDVTDSTDAYNPCVAWNTEEYPWHDLSIITLTTPLSEEALFETEFKLDTHPQEFSPNTEGSKEFSAFSKVIREFHGVDEAPVKVPPHKDSITKYRIVVSTGKLVGAGTDADIHITITGKNGRTDPIDLDQKLRDDFEPGQVDAFERKAVSVGAFIVIDMNLSSFLPGRKWFLNDVTIMDQTTGLVARFPCYQWLTSQQPKVTLPRAEAVLRQQELGVLAFMRRQYELGERRRRYEWDGPAGLPGRMKTQRYEDLPREVQFSSERKLDLLDTFARTVANTGKGNIITLGLTWNIVQDNMKLLTNFLKDTQGVQRVSRQWKEDTEFGRQMLAGPHPTRIHRVTSLPDVFHKVITDLDDLMGDSMVDFEIEKGHLYMVTHEELLTMDPSRSYKGKYERHVAAPTCLLHVRADDSLVPVAIHLAAGGPVWLPSDAPLDWQFAKMWVREADAQVHHVISRHLHTHLVMEAVAMATMRNLPTVHPVYKLLFPHFRYTISVNSRGRRGLYPADKGLFERYLAVGGQHETLLRVAFAKFHVNDLHLPKNLQARGVADTSALPGYHYRDDALLLWNAVNKFVRLVLTLHYWKDDQVQADGEIQKWIQDLHTNGLPPSPRDPLSTTTETKNQGPKLPNTTEKESQRSTLPNTTEKESQRSTLPNTTEKDSQRSTLPNTGTTDKDSQASPLPDNTSTSGSTKGDKDSPDQVDSESNASTDSPDNASTDSPDNASTDSPDNASTDSPDNASTESEAEESTEEDHGIPAHLDKLGELIDLITIFIFTASVQHTALTAGILDYQAFVPNCPTMLLSPPPARKGAVTAISLRQALPSRFKTHEIIAACYTISHTTSDQVALGEFPEELFEDKPTRGAILAFQEDMQNITEAIRKRNLTASPPYTYLLPQNISKSASV